MPTVASDAPESSMAYRLRASDLVARLGTNEQNGLSDEEARARLAQYGFKRAGRGETCPGVAASPVAVSGCARHSAARRHRDLRRALGRGARRGPAVRAIAIAAVVLLNATMGYVQESRAEAAVAALRAMSAADASVIRGGERRTIPASQIVPGDILLVGEGDTIAADGRLVESVALQTAEASLTGESLPVTKDTAAIAEDVPLGDRDNMVFSGTAATYGHGKAVVTATGMRTEMGRIAGLLKATPDEATPLQRELDRTGRRSVWS